MESTEDAAWQQADAEALLLQGFASAEDGDEAAAWQSLEPLIRECHQDPVAAHAVAVAMGHPSLGTPQRLKLASALLQRWVDHPAILAALGAATETLCDLRYLNAAPPTNPFFAAVTHALHQLARACEDDAQRLLLCEALATAARVCGRAWDDACSFAHHEVLRQRPNRWQDHYNHGLFLKTRGRFEEGMHANLKAAQLAGEHQDCIVWNLGICATACGAADAALAQWKQLGNTIELGPDGLPQGDYANVQVRLAQFPLAERGASDVADEPGMEETIWIERLSPCHGRIRSALFHTLGVDYGDLVLFDGAPILTRTVQDREVPVFPHLSTLGRGQWKIFDVAATQQQDGQVAALSAALPQDAEIYVHTEALRALCPTCWEKGAQAHAHHDHAHRVVVGKLCVPPTVALNDVAAALDSATQLLSQVNVVVPTLQHLLGNQERAQAEQRQYELLTQKSP